MDLPFELSEALLAALVSVKIGADEWFRRRDTPGGNGKNGNATLGRRVADLEKKVDGFGVKLDALAGTIRDEADGAKTWASREHEKLHEKINACAQDVARVDGRLDGLTAGGG